MSAFGFLEAWTAGDKGAKRAPSPPAAGTRAVWEPASAVLSALPCGALLCDAAGTVILANVPAAELLGHGPEDLIGRRIDDPAVWPPVVLAADESPTDAQGLAAEALVAAAGTFCDRIVGLASRAGAAPTWVTFGARPVQVARGGADGVICLFTDASLSHASVRQLWGRAGRLRALLDCVPDSYIVLDAADRISEWYGGEMPFIPRRRDRLVGTPLADLLPPECAETAVVSFAEVRSGLPASGFDLSWETDDGLRFGEAVCRLLPDGTLAVIVRDVTERWRAEEELLTLEEHYRLLAENARDVITRLRCGPVPKIEYISPSVELLLGYAPEEFYRDDTMFFRALRPDMRAQARAIIAGSWDFDRPWESCFVHRDGREVWVEQQMTPSVGRGGEVLAIDGVSRDVTEKRDQAARLRESEARYRLLAAPEWDVIWQLRVWPERRHEYISPSAERLLGYTAAELMADPAVLYGLLAPESRASIERASRGQMDSDESQLLHWTARDGRDVFTEGHVTTVKDEEGRPIIVHGVARDVTRRVLAERALREVHRTLGLQVAVREILLTAPEQEVFTRVVDAVCSATQSRHGAFVLVRDGRIVSPPFTEGRWRSRAVGGKTVDFPYEPDGEELFDRAIAGGRSLVAECPARLPGGHMPMDRALATPVVYKGATIGLIIVANRPRPYDDGVVKLLEGVAAQVAPLLNARLGLDR